MRYLLVFLLVLPLAGYVAAVDDEPQPSSAEALEILKKADAAIKAIKSVRMSGTARPEGSAVNFMKPAEGTTLMVGWAGNIPQKFYSEVKIVTDEGTTRLTGGGDGDTYFIIDHADKKAYEDMDPGVLGSHGNTLQSIAVVEFVHDAPFDQEMESDLKLLPEETVGGEPCYRIFVVYPGGGQESVWYFSKKDYLPRRRIQKWDFGGGGSVDKLVTKLEINPEIEPSLFKMKLPKGYEQIDDFAP